MYSIKICPCCIQRFLEMTSRIKKRIVLPTRPDPPNIEQILQDVQGALASDPVFFCDFNNDTLLSANDFSSERDKQYRQTCTYVGMNDQLKEFQMQLKDKCDALRCSGKKLEQDIKNLKEAAM
ncbi:hypothetical protein GDO86_000989 [Hymenochirus boettgeri]|uniref:Uncharacterized protein n=1 Tax=Hymenochirus boettgeri TaxID=247094 RepID=A0A8T2KG97_9PIPI|nr:hypothetical protein GDO86_000989 [Hymenochirus boettgeri]